MIYKAVWDSDIGLYRLTDQKVENELDKYDGYYMTASKTIIGCNYYYVILEEGTEYYKYAHRLLRKYEVMGECITGIKELVGEADL